MRTLAEIRARLAEIGTLLETRSADLDVDALTAEVDELKAEERRLVEMAESRSALLERVRDAEPAAGINPFARADAPAAEERTFDASSPEYRTAFLKNLAHQGGQWRLGEMTDAEQRAFTFLTTNTTAVLPTGIQLGIVDMISAKYALLGDLNPSTFSGAVEFQQAGPIVSGAAGETAENTANAEDLRVTFTKVTMTGVEIKGDVKLSRKMQLQSIDGFEAWLTAELSREMGAAMNAHAWDSVDDDMLVGNKSTPAALDSDAVRAAFGVLKGGEGQRVAYANNATIWNHIAAVEDANGREKFIESSVTDDPAVQGRIYGTTVKLDDTLEDGVIFVGYPATIKANTFEAPNVMSEVDVKTREVTHAGYALFEARLGDTRAWAKITVTEASA